MHLSHRPPSSKLQLIGVAAMIAAAVVPGRVLTAQRGDTSGELVVGTYHFLTNGSMRYVEPLQNQTNTYTDEEHSEWILRFYRAGGNLAMKTHGQSYNRVSTITIDYTTGGLEKVVKHETWSYAGDNPTRLRI